MRETGQPPNDLAVGKGEPPVTELEQARIEAEAALVLADMKLKRLNELRWAEAERRVGENDFLAMLDELANFSDVDWPTGCFYHPDGDYLEVYWQKPGDKPVVMSHHNALVETFHAVDEDGELSVGPVGCRIMSAKGVLERAGVYLTPDPPNPSRAVQAAKAVGVCRVCREPLNGGTVPKNTAERFGNQLYPEALVFNCGEEYAHQACLNQEKAEEAA